MKVLVFGPHWEGSHSWLIRTQFEARGAEVVVVDPSEQSPLRQSTSFGAKVARRLLRRVTGERTNAALLAAARSYHPDLVVISKGSEIKEATIARLKAGGATLVNWSPDDYENPANSSPELIRSLRHFDLVVSPRQARFNAYRALGARRLLYLDWYFAPELHFSKNVERDLHVSFVGSWSPERERFFGALRCPAHIFGGGWEKARRSRLGRHRVVPGPLDLERYRSVIWRSRFNVNLLTTANFDVTNQRVFEVTACGGLLVSERTAEIDALLGDEHGYLGFDSPAELEAILLEPLDPDRVRRTGLERVMAAKASFADRFETLYEAIVK